jgi:hypothetical protein
MVTADASWLHHEVFCVFLVASSRGRANSRIPDRPYWLNQSAAFVEEPPFSFLASLQAQNAVRHFHFLKSRARVLTILPSVAYFFSLLGKVPLNQGWSTFSGEGLVLFLPRPKITEYSTWILGLNSFISLVWQLWSTAL